MMGEKTKDEASPVFDVEDHPILETERLRLRRITVDDAALISRLAGDRRVAAMTLTMPHPYEVSMARAFIGTLSKAYAEGHTVTFGVVQRRDETFVGMCGIKLEPDHDRAELGYWIGVPYWGNGFATEAVRAVVDFAFRVRGCFRVHAQAYTANPASRRVLEKAGLRYEGCLRGHIVRLGTRQDVENFGILRPDWESFEST